MNSRIKPNMHIKKLRIAKSLNNTLTINREKSINPLQFLSKDNKNNDSSININNKDYSFKKKLLFFLNKNKTINKPLSYISNFVLKSSESDKYRNINSDMKNKFYMRKREGLKVDSSSETVFKILHKSPSSKLILSLNGFFNKKRINEKKNKEKIFFKNRFKKYNIKKINSTSIKNEHLISRINNLKNKTNENCKNCESNIYNENEKNTITSYHNKYWKVKPRLNNLVIKNYNKINNIITKRAKIHSKLFCKSLFDLQDENQPYEIINKENSETNIMHKVYYNKDNLDRIIKVDKIKKKGYNEDDEINDYNNIKKFNEDIGFILKRLRETKNPRSIKINNFSRSTLSKYNCYTRSNFGFPN